MALPRPYPGLVISYSYLWHHQSALGADEGRKDRPCAIVLATADEHGQTIVLVVPISHAEPEDPHAVELPRKLKKHLGLDSKRSWVVTDQLNRFIWPGHDLRAISRRKPHRYDWGFLPDDVVERIKAGIRANRAAGRLKQVSLD